MKKKYKFITAVLSLITFGAFAQSNCPTTPITAPLINLEPSKPGWNLIFSDEFTGSTVDLTKWNKRSMKQ